jgi:hypothetical protein
MRYYSLCGSNLVNTGVARVPDDFDDYAFWDDLEARRSSNGWRAISAILSQGSDITTGPEPCDLLCSDLLPRLCSAKLRELLSVDSQKLVWLPVSVWNGSDSLDYFILHFTEFPDVLNEARTEYAGGGILKPHLDIAKLKGRKIIALNPLSLSWIVCETVRKKIEDAGCTGIEFEPIASN